MSCVSTVGTKQTEFEFYQQLMNIQDSSQCCGPKYHLVLSKLNVSQLAELLEVVGVSVDYLDTFDPEVLDSQYLSLTMCARHWLQIQDLLHEGSHQTGNDSWNDLSFYIFKMTCLLNGWDSKEMQNYLS